MAADFLCSSGQETANRVPAGFSFSARRKTAQQFIKRQFKIIKIFDVEGNGGEAKFKICTDLMRVDYIKLLGQVWLFYGKISFGCPERISCKCEAFSNLI